MAGRRWSTRDVAASMRWWCLIILAIEGCRGVLAIDSAATEPSAALPHGEEGGCYRALSDVIWGFLVTLLALTVSLWSSMKHRDDGILQTCFTFLVGVCLPLTDLELILCNSLQCVSLLWVCHKMEHPNLHIMSPSWLKFLCSSLFPWSKSLARILACCDIVVYVSKELPLLQRRWLWSSICNVRDESEAMVVGENGKRAIRNDHYVRKELNEQGIGLLVWQEVFFKAEDSKCLPKYDELKYLRANSGFAVIALAAQASGYIYAVGFWSAKNLRISPLEVIGLVFNIILWIKIFFYSTCNPCHRPLVIYMDKDWEQEVGKFNDNNCEKLRNYSIGKVEVIILFGIVVGLNTLLIYFTVNMIKATNLVVSLPIIFFSIGLSLWFLGFLHLRVTDTVNSKTSITIGYVAGLVNAMSYIWAIVGIVLYWRTMHFNTRAELINLSQILPFIGEDLIYLDMFPM